MSTSKPMTQEQLDAIQERVDATTEGPWEQCGRGIDGGPSSITEVVTLDVECMGYCYGGTGLGVQNEADAEFIAHARQDVPALLAEVERRGARLTVDDDMVERAKRAFGAATAQVSSIPLGMSEDMFIDSVGLQHQHAIRAALDVALGTGEGA